jgi:hypothetical protein
MYSQDLPFIDRLHAGGDLGCDVARLEADLLGDGVAVVSSRGEED